GGLATGMKSVHKDGNGIWIGWSGLTDRELDQNLTKEVKKLAWEEKCVTVGLSQYDIDNFYYGLSNRALWPLFHYFMEYTEFEQQFWESYKVVNQKFADVVLEHVEDGDQIWIHDYQLMLLPEMIRARKANVSIGFFL